MSTFARCPGECGKWRVRVAGAFGRWCTRRHEPCGRVELPKGHQVRTE